MSKRESIERDADGNVTKMIRYDAKGDLLFTHETVWENGRIVRKTSYRPDGSITASFDYAYDERGNNTEGSWFVYNNGTLMKAAFVYDENGLMTEKTHFGTGSIATNKTFMKYREDGKLVLSEYYEVWPDSAPVYTIYEYNEDGFPTRQTTEDAQHNVLYYEVFKPNELGKVAEYTNYGADGKPVYTYKYYYGPDGSTVKTERYDGEGKLVSTSLT